MRESFEKFERLDVKVVVVAPANRDQIQEFLNVHGPFPFEIYGDPELDLYEEMGNHNMTTVKSMLSVGADLLKGEVKISDIVPKDKKERKHFLSAVKNQDVNIQGSSWLFDRNGNVLWKHMDDTPEDHAKVDEVLKQLRK
ncbi:AhpC/TSA family protein [Fictibacillus sp. 26RED30]|uniref:AhpC/TSA family protein n=1 Tax=Fictibacillus sp. 26RED30 TaxID=2745877 RepID=UPI0018CF3BC3|nr:AhpC/TSA family protein [Fictibacillus sp. 26RED30]MBH0162545.1 AhpC/TSA family protein [Fictibacillus sp. 26RED30]